MNEDHRLKVSRNKVKAIVFALAIMLVVAIALLSGTVLFCSCSANEDNATEIVNQPTISRIQERGTLLAGTTGDYRPLSFHEDDGTYWGFGIEVAGEVAKRLGVGLQFVPTSWPTLSADVQAPDFGNASPKILFQVE